MIGLSVVDLGSFIKTFSFQVRGHRLSYKAQFSSVKAWSESKLSEKHVKECKSLLWESLDLKGAGLVPTSNSILCSSSRSMFIIQTLYSHFGEISDIRALGKISFFSPFIIKA